MKLRFNAVALFIGISVCLISLSVHSAPKNHWTQFRGWKGSGVAENSKPPTEFSTDKNVKWKTELISGLSSPVIWNDKIFLTGFNDNALKTICIDRNNGEILWSKTSPAKKIEQTHSASSPAASTPVVDGDHVYVYFGSFGLLCYDHEGNQQWQHPVSTPVNMHGAATSPIQYKDMVYLMHDSMNGDSFMLAVNKKTGDEAWKTKRPVLNPNWSSPVIWNTENGDELIILGGGKLQSYDPLTGKELWAITGFGAPIPVPIIGDGMLYASTVSATEIDTKVSVFTWDYYVKFDHNNDGKVEADEIPDDDMIAMDPDLPDQTMQSKSIISWLDNDNDKAMTQEEFQGYMDLIMMNVRSSIKAIKPGVNANNAEDHVAWKYERSIPYMPSCLYFDGIIYMAKDGGIVTALDAKTGKEIYRKRIGQGNYSSSPVLANDHVYISSQEGLVTVFKAGKEPKKIAENELGERIATTPAIMEDTIYIRTENHLYAFANQFFQQYSIVFPKG